MHSAARNSIGTLQAVRQHQDQADGAHDRRRVREVVTRTRAHTGVQSCRLPGGVRPRWHTKYVCFQRSVAPSCCKCLGEAGTCALSGSTRSLRAGALLLARPSPALERPPAANAQCVGGHAR
jgi:hypothetical protein